MDDTAPTEAEHFRNALALPERPRALDLAEQNCAKLRVDRQSIRDRLVGAISAYSQPGALVSDEDINSIQGELDALEMPTGSARRLRDKLRADFGKRAMEAIGADVAAYEAAILRRLSELEELLRAGMDLQATAAARGLPVHRIIDKSRSLAGKIHAMRMIVRD